MAGCRKRRLNQALSVLSLSLGFCWCMWYAVNYRDSFYVVLFFCYLCVLSLGCSRQVVSTSTSGWLERLASEMTYNVLMGTLNPTHSLTHSLTRNAVLPVMTCNVNRNPNSTQTDPDYRQTILGSSTEFCENRLSSFFRNPAHKQTSKQKYKQTKWKT